MAEEESPPDMMSQRNLADLSESQQQRDLEDRFFGPGRPGDVSDGEAELSDASGFSLDTAEAGPAGSGGGGRKSKGRSKKASKQNTPSRFLHSPDFVPTNVRKPKTHAVCSWDKAWAGLERDAVVEMLGNRDRRPTSGNGMFNVKQVRHQSV